MAAYATCRENPPREFSSSRNTALRNGQLRENRLLALRFSRSHGSPQRLHRIRTFRKPAPGSRPDLVRESDCGHVTRRKRFTQCNAFDRCAKPLIVQLRLEPFVSPFTHKFVVIQCRIGRTYSINLLFLSGTERLTSIQAPNP